MQEQVSRLCKQHQFQINFLLNYLSLEMSYIPDHWKKNYN